MCQELWFAFIVIYVSKNTCEVSLFNGDTILQMRKQLCNIQVPTYSKEQN